MFAFAHVFFGALIGLGFWHLTHNRRALPLCILSAILPDLLDKPLALLFPDIVGSGRTIGHSLLFLGITAALGLLLWRYRHTLLGMACACAIVSHQVLDAMWNIPSTWYYPLMGPFSEFIIPDYIGHFVWLEISTPSEWVFAWASVIITGTRYLCMQEHHVPCLTSQKAAASRLINAFLLGIMGVALVYSGLAAVSPAFFAPTYDPVTSMMGGLVALCGSIALLKWPAFFSGNC
jgi:hypothetical protein